jgi:hypothetical protein
MVESLYAFKRPHVQKYNIMPSSSAPWQLFSKNNPDLAAGVFVTVLTNHFRFLFKYSLQAYQKIHSNP